MNVLIFGATGGIGKWTVEFAKKKGYLVTVYVRNARKIIDSSIRVIEGELDDYRKMEEAMSGQDAVIWCVGIAMKRNYEGMPSVEGHRNLLKAMKKAGVTRLIDWGTPSIPFEKDEKSVITVIPGILAELFLTKAKKEMVEIGHMLSESDIDWTLVRFMAPKDTSYTGKVKVSFGKRKMKFAISRADIASFMVEQVEDGTYVRSMPIIGS